jgi:hypothetical protein
MSWVTDDGHRIDVVALAANDGYRPHALRVTAPDGRHIGYFATVGDLRGAIDLNGLRDQKEADPRNGGTGERPASRPVDPDSGRQARRPPAPAG